MIQKRLIRLCPLAVSIFALSAALPAVLRAEPAAGQETSSAEAEVKSLVEELREQKRALQEKEQELAEQQKFLDLKLSEVDETLGEAQKLLGEADDAGVESARLAEMSGRGPREVGTERKTESEQKPEVPAVAIDTGGVLLPKGRFVLEPSVSYSRSSALRVAVEGYTVVPAINIGSFDISDIDRDIITAAITARLGLTNRLEIETTVPYIWREDSRLARQLGVGATTNTLSEADGSGLGDIEVAAHYQINDGKDNWPFFIANIRYKSTTGEGPFDVAVDPSGLQAETPTGSGFHAIQPSLTMLYPTDPAVFFLNSGYTWNLEEDVGGGNGDIDPGDSANFSLGMGFSINDKTSFSLGYSHSVVFETEQNGATFANSDVLQVGSTTFGYSYQVNERFGMNFNVAAGVTDDAPDLTVSLRLPFKFDLF